MFLLLSFQSLAFNSYKETFSLVKLQLTSVLAHLEGVSIAFSKIVAPFSISVEFSCSVMSDSLWPHEPQHTRPPWPSPTPRVHSNPCLLSQWCQSIISFSAVPFSSCPQPFPVSGSFLMNQLFTWGGQSIGVSASTSVLPRNTQDWSPLGWISWISLQRDSQEYSPTPQFKSINFSVLSFLHSPTLTSIHDHWKNHSLD